MDVPNLQKRIHNLESSIAFLQKEHASMLTSLHEEIRRLQTKNSEYSFQLAVGTASHPKQWDEQAFRGLEEETLRLRSLMKGLEERLESKSKRKHLLKQQLVATEVKCAHETATHQKLVHDLQSQLEEKSAVILKLTEKLDGDSLRKSKTSSPLPADVSEASVAVSHGQKFVPNPPARPESGEAGGRVLSGFRRRSAGVSPRNETLDRSQFMVYANQTQKRVSIDEVRVKPGPSVLPPIQSGGQALFGRHSTDLRILSPDPLLVSAGDKAHSGTSSAASAGTPLCGHTAPTPSGPTMSSGNGLLERQTFAVQPVSPIPPARPHMKPT